MKRNISNMLPGLIFEARELNLDALPKIDSHLHTSWTDGEAGVEETYRKAVEIGLEVILYSEHSRKTSTDWFQLFAAQVRGLPQWPCKPYVGTEVKVELLDGSIDTAPSITELCDFTMASVHRFPDPNGNAIAFADIVPADAVDMEYQLTWAVLANPQVDILGHIFGMSYRRFGVIPSPRKITELMERAAEYGVAVEINSHYHPNPHEMINWAREIGTRITFGSNAHTLDKVGHIMTMLREENRA